jgi:hypothetical protein
MQNQYFNKDDNDLKSPKIHIKLQSKEQSTTQSLASSFYNK